MQSAIEGRRRHERRKEGAACMKWLKRMGKRLRNINHLFAKATIVWCILWGTAFCFYALRIMARTGQDAAGLLAVIVGFLGGELLLLCVRTVLNERRSATGRETQKEKE